MMEFGLQIADCGFIARGMWQNKYEQPCGLLGPAL